ncbi:hypothetical protein A2714_00720 [Candidatus Woesebacteria bacterium RIFCSPHIGHO2_01_FULL_38_9]|uniref:Uncharacterized protein n=1 Tax=Candidatus Woesebacteria bacterium RIFCSPHIGHO2_01_FULL_38_9 TaxID=1802492 RepID=A0A1F7Y2W2_9BACT|nr:MAG: hypothetical protein A2714_00720 [Candidatus Woesebacteria bacterium RIFCSPHIGHO2_01_FULL_38_9]
MSTQSVRTTIDINEDLARKLKEYSARHGLTQKTVITQAVSNYIGNEAKEKDAKFLWLKLRKIAKEGRQDLDLIGELRKDRNR